MTERSETEIQAEINALKKAIGSGVTSMSYDGRTISYRSMDEMKEAMASLEAELGAATELGRETRFFSYVGRGY